MGTPYGFTGEIVDGSGLLDLRARRYAPGLGVFASLDPWEGLAGRTMSLNGYSWVEGNVVNATDASGQCIDNSVCRQLRQNGGSIRQLIAAGCIDSEQRSCCGPDATEWIYGEIANHFGGNPEYASPSDELIRLFQ